jgi:hypothetical protein
MANVIRMMPAFCRGNRITVDDLPPLDIFKAQNSPIHPSFLSLFGTDPFYYPLWPQSLSLKSDFNFRIHKVPY